MKLTPGCIKAASKTLTRAISSVEYDWELLTVGWLNFPFQSFDKFSKKSLTFNSLKFDVKIGSKTL